MSKRNIDFISILISVILAYLLGIWIGLTSSNESQEGAKRYQERMQQIIFNNKESDE